tara:strand:+ start:470 stop:1177 length:708 start_codon:yes stop_codon:yes gene_type:complete
MSENHSFFQMIIFKFKKFFYLFYGEKFFKKKRYNWGLYPQRYQIIQELINLNKYDSYLEIGCDKNQSFSTVSIKDKVGVDPSEGGTHKMTSDDFFSKNKKKFDIIFIDGLHEYNQVMKDIFNSLNCLSPHGIILLHDCLPRNIWNQITPRINSDWNGDTWKSIVHCRTLDHIDTYTIVADRGIGLIFPRHNRSKLFFDKKKNLKLLKYREYYEKHSLFMNLVYYSQSNLIKLFDK